MKKIKVEVVAGLPGKNVIITKGKKPGTLNFNVPLKLFKTWEVTNVDWQEKGSRNAGKAAGGALAGTLLGGLPGMLLGAAAGGRKKDTSTAVLTIKEGEAARSLTVRCTEKDLNIINNNNNYI